MTVGYIQTASILKGIASESNLNCSDILYITKIEKNRVYGYSDANSEIKAYKFNLSFKTVLTILLAQNFIKQAQLADELGISRQLLRYKINEDKFTRQELGKMKELLHLSSEDFEMLMKLEN